MNDDAALLRLYVENRSEAAFTELVRRHIGLVHATALRRVGGDVQLADDVTQLVFISLARKAPGLVSRTSLAGWLYLSAQLESAEAVRAEQRRKARENTAHAMDLTHSPDQPTADIAQLRALLDSALVDLEDDDREAIVLRFFQKQTFAQIGAALRVTEEAARKRVDRALDKLHGLLGQRGVTSSVAALGVALTAAGIGATADGLVAKVAGAALSEAAGGMAAATATGTIGVLPPLTAAAAVVLGGLALLSQGNANASLAAEVSQLQRQHAGIPALRTDNEHLARSLAEVQARPAPVVAPSVRGVVRVAPPPAPTPARISNVVTLTTDGAVAWEGKVGRLDDYLARLVALQQTAPAGESSLVIQANGGRFRQMFWVLDEARKAGIRHIKVESDAQPDPAAPGMWF